MNNCTSGILCGHLFLKDHLSKDSFGPGSVEDNGNRDFTVTWQYQNGAQFSEALQLARLSFSGKVVFFGYGHQSSFDLAYK